jgi:hypothetical protein
MREIARQKLILIRAQLVELSIGSEKGNGVCVCVCVCVSSQYNTTVSKQTETTTNCGFASCESYFDDGAAVQRSVVRIVNAQHNLSSFKISHNMSVFLNVRKNSENNYAMSGAVIRPGVGRCLVSLQFLRNAGQDCLTNETIETHANNTVVISQIVRIFVGNHRYSCNDSFVHHRRQRQQGKKKKKKKKKRQHFEH